MTLPLFQPSQDPGPSFSNLLDRLEDGAIGACSAGSPGIQQGLLAQDSLAHACLAHGAMVQVPQGLGSTGLGSTGLGSTGLGVAGAGPVPIAHGTTIVALRYLDGIVMAGDRRATEGVSIAHRSIEKVFPADRFSAIGIAGAAGPAVEMVRLFQTQLEHYEKVEGAALSLEGKANQLAQMVRANLTMAMQGLVVVPLLAGFDLRRLTGRIFSYDVTGGRYEETEFHAIGSGGRDARTTVKLGYRQGLSREQAVELAVNALYQAADEDAATGGPDPGRGIYPIVASVDASGYAALDESEVAERFAAVVEARSLLARESLSSPPAAKGVVPPGSSASSPGGTGRAPRAPRGTEASRGGQP